MYRLFKSLGKVVARQTTLPYTGFEALPHSSALSLAFVLAGTIRVVSLMTAHCLVGLEKAMGEE